MPKARGRLCDQESHPFIEMAKLYNIKIYDYILFLLSERPSMNMTDEELDKLSPWSEGIQERI